MISLQVFRIINCVQKNPVESFSQDFRDDLLVQQLLPFMVSNVDHVAIPVWILIQKPRLIFDIVPVPPVVADFTDTDIPNKERIRILQLG